MKNTIASFIISFILLIFMIFSVNYLNKKCTHYSEIANSMEKLIVSDSWDDSYTLCMNFLNQWKKDSKLVAVFVNHMHLDSINTALLKLTQFIKCEDKAQSLALIHEIKFLLDDIYNIEKISIENIF